MNDDEQASTVNWKWFCILAGTMILVGVATYFFLPSLISKTETDVIIVKAPETPIKVKPTEASGKIVDHQNLLIVDILKGGTRKADQTETLRPLAPNPEPPPVNVAKDAASKTRDKAGKARAKIDAGQKLVDVPESARTSANKGNNKALVRGSEITPETSTKEAIAKNKAAGKPVAKEGGSTKESASEMKKRVVVIEGNAPRYMIQLAAFRNAKRATEMAKILSQKHKSRLKDVDLRTMRVDNGSNGIFYRIVSVPLPRQDADKMCSILRRSGQDCFLRKHETTTP
tara:strand:- start:1682 stop:2539 length:858 start_codon:yes stop_codon:yes gene_type:complete